MQLYLDSYGAYLSVRDGLFSVRTRHGGTRAFAARDVQAILLTRATAFSTDAVLLAAANGIPLLIIDANTHFPLAQLSGGQPGSIATIRKNQAFFARSAGGYTWVAGQLAEKIAGQRALLARLSDDPRAPAGFAADVRLADRVLAGLEQEFRKPLPFGPVFDAGDSAGVFRGREGTASRLYFNQLAKLLAGRFPAPPLDTLDAIPFSGRQKRPAYDPFNVLLNYLYGMLYTAVHLALLKAGLDPYLGILHADQYGAAPTLVFDAIEPYRPWADAVALQLALDGRIDPALAFEQRADPTEGLWLSGAGKDVVIDAMLAFLEAPAPAAGETRLLKRRVQIDRGAQQLATLLRDGA